MELEYFPDHIVTVLFDNKISLRSCNGVLFCVQSNNSREIGQNNWTKYQH